MTIFLKVVCGCYFRKKLHLRRLNVFWIRLWTWCDWIFVEFCEKHFLFSLFCNQATSLNWSKVAHRFFRYGFNFKKCSLVFLRLPMGKYLFQVVTKAGEQLLWIFLVPTQLAVQSQQWKHQNNVWNLFKFGQWCRSGVFIVNIEQISRIVLVFSLLTLYK